MLSNKLWAMLAVAVLALGGCATTDEGAPPEGEAGAETRPAEGPGALEGGALADPGAARAELLARKRVYFAFDSSAIDEESRAVIEAHAAQLLANPSLKLRLEGHGDERGTREYNLALGERRAQAVERLMRVLGVAASRITTVSYGEEKPLCAEHDESCWRQNRRVEIGY